MAVSLNDFISVKLKRYSRESPWERLRVPYRNKKQKKWASVHNNEAQLHSANKRNDNCLIQRSSTWRLGDMLTLVIKDIPVTWLSNEGGKLYNLWEPLHDYGTIEFMKINEPLNGQTSTTAIVQFAPPPKVPFWEPNGKINVKGVDLAVQIDITAHRSHISRQVFSKKSFRSDQLVKIPLSSFKLGQVYDERIVPLFGVDCGITVTESNLLVYFNFKKLCVLFDASFDKQIETFRLDFDFHSIIGDVGTDYYDDHISLVFRFRFSPLIFRKSKNATESRVQTFWTASHLWRRHYDILPFNVSSTTASPIELLNCHNAPIGRCNVLVLSFSIRDESDKDDIAFILHNLEKFNLKSQLDKVVFHLVPDYKHRCSLINDKEIEEEIAYLLQACLSKNLLSEIDLPIILANLKKLSKERAKKFLRLILTSKTALINPSELDFTKSFVFYDLSSASSIHIKKLYVTPTTLRIVEDSLEAGNRVIRNFKDFANRFMRVQITDEYYKQKIRGGSDGFRNEKLYSRIQQLLTYGIKVGNQVYEFLAFGNSQLREHAAYFFASGSDLNVKQIREWMGDFSEINSVSKYAARMGQCFSTTKEINRFCVDISLQDDIVRNNHCFTDGVGMASLSVIRRLSLEVKNHDMFPSAFQFRMGGYKGVLSLAPPTKLEYHQGNLVFPRRSQDKFKSFHSTLEVIKISRFSNAHLNMQLITLLEGLGVEKTVFLELTRSQLSKMNESINSKQKSILMLRDNVDEYHSTLIIADFIQAGFLERDDAFTENLLNLYYEWVLRLIKEKQKVSVPKGAYLLGVADETGTLKGHYDDAVLSVPEIFIQITDTSTSFGSYSTGKLKTRVIVGLCIVARNPSLHPGDVRVCKAVRCDELMHLKNVIVFPTTGDRSIPAMCSGGDLDGDEYTVIWDQRLLPKIVNYPPLLESSPKKSIDFLEGKPLIDSVKEFFVNYIKYDSLGLISNAWKAWAHDHDNNPEGIFGNVCLELAEMHSKAVDFAKSGVACKMQAKYHPKRYPDFMQKTKTRSFRSETAVGKIFRYAARFQRESGRPATYNPIMNTVYDPCMKLPRFKTEYLNVAEEVKKHYDNDLRSIMTRFDISTEYEVYTAFILFKDDLAKTVNEYGLREEVSFQFDLLKKKYTQEYLEKCALSNQSAFDSSEYEERINSAVAATYDVTYDQRVKSVGNGTTEVLISFPYLFSSRLCQLSRKAMLTANNF